MWNDLRLTIYIQEIINTCSPVAKMSQAVPDGLPVPV